MERSLQFLIWFATYVFVSHGCTMQGVTQWLAPQHESIVDTYRGLIIERSTSDIEDINRIDFGDGLNRGPYLELTLENSTFTVTTTDAFADYEEYETLLSIRVTTTFRCAGGTFRPLTFVFNIQDTNNHYPVFIPTDNYDFPLALPVPPGFNVTKCEYIIVRDVDLTTRAIEFGIDDNPYFNIIYSRQIQAKEFGGFINTKNVIRSTSESLSYQISATDVDETNDDPLTSYATLNILANNEFRLPDEPIFSKAFYKADYTEDHALSLREYISLRQGYDDQVIFDFEGAYADYFELVVNNNDVSFRVKSPLPSDISETQIFLVVKAEREFTSGATATVVVLLPEGVDVMFESSLYEGEIEDNVLRAPNLTLTQGYEEIQEIEIISEHASYFTASRQGNTITLAMSPLPVAVIQSNSVLNLQVVASANRSSSVCVVALELIKDDYITPAFEKTIYNGNYNPETGLSVESIVLLQGYDNTVVIDLKGEHKSYFQIVQKDAIIDLTASIPPELWPEGSLILTIQATKPRTVGANAAVLVNLPAARELMFEAPSYSGSIKNNVLTLENIILSVGYAEDVRFKLSGMHTQYFTVRNTENKVSINLNVPLPDNIILENNFIVLTVSASGLNAASASTIILLEILKSDTTTPIFSQQIYMGIYRDPSNVEIENVFLVQGFDNTVIFRLDGDHAQYFKIDNFKNEVKISLKSQIPEEIIFTEKTLLFKILAEKELTVGASAVVSIQFPQELTEPTIMQFSKDYYLGSLNDYTFEVIDNIVLDSGFRDGTRFILSGEYAEHFAIANEDNIVSISMLHSAPMEELKNNNFIILQVEAHRERAVSVSSSLVVDIVSPDIIVFPVFEKPFYSGHYTIEDGLHFEHKIRLTAGFDSTVTFQLEGDASQWFLLEERDNSVVIKRNETLEIPSDVIELNHQLLFSIVAHKPGTIGGRSAISITLLKDHNEQLILRFEENNYIGKIKDGTVHLPPLYLNKDVTTVAFRMTGEYSSYFSIVKKDTEISIKLTRDLNIDDINTSFIVLTIEASHVEAMNGYTTVVLKITDIDKSVVTPVFEKAYYMGDYTEDSGLSFDHTIRLVQGFDDSVSFYLEGNDAQGFVLNYEIPNNVILSVNTAELPSVTDRSHLTFSIIANTPQSIAGRTAIVISLKDVSTPRILRFTDDHYKGFIKEGVLNLDVINLKEGYSEQVRFSLSGDYVDYFQFTNKDGKITLQLASDLPSEITEYYNILILVLEAQIESTRTHTIIVLEVEPQKDANDPVLMFEKTYYTGSYSETNDFTFDSQISLITGYDNHVQFSLDGDNSVWFGLEQRAENSFGLMLKHPLPPAVLANNRKLIFIIIATRPGSVTARATVVISLNYDTTQDSVLGFEKISYSGTISNGVINLEAIVLNEGYTSQVSFSLLGELASLFSLSIDGPTVNIILRGDLPEDLIPLNRIILLELRASAPQALPAFAIIILAIEHENNIQPVEQPSFAETYYLGHYTEQEGLTFNQKFSLARGYDDSIMFALEGDTQADVTFDKILYNGFLRLGIVTHELITLTGYNEPSLEILGQYAELFEANIANQEVTVSTKPTSVLPNVVHIALELHAGGASSVLLLTILEPETPALPTVTFDSPSYVLRVDVTHTGLVGRVRASADNGETVIYSLLNKDANLQGRLSVNSNGELWLSAPAPSGAHFLQLVATTVITRVTGNAPVHLLVEAVTVCGDNIVVPPLIVLDRDEEEPHRNLVVLNQTAFVGCQFDLSNSWPENQQWLYIDSDGLHAHAIDREHESIAFMALSQIQVDLILRCESDTTSRSKRSLNSNPRLDWLGPYEYGSNKWILTDSIPYNARRSLVNLIVNDINDNAPIFVGKENEPIAVGYPIQSLEEIILPRALAELKATDADIGENAALVYWSVEDSIAVSPSTGFVHVRNHFNLENNTRLIIQATDQKGAGLTGSLELVVRLLEKDHIAILTIRNAFLEDEDLILSEISKSVGYEVKTLKTIVTSEYEPSRNKRGTSGSEQVLGPSLQLFVYGLIERQPVEVNQLITDIKNSNIVTVNVASTISLEDHLDGNETCVLPGRDIGLLVATIVLSVLMFMLLVAIAVWFLIRKLRNKYEKFSDKNSLASRKESIEEPKSDIISKPRLNIEELRKSEKRLQERLRVPIVNVSDEPTTSKEKPFEAIINISTPDPNLPIVIQTIDKLKDKSEESDDDDEFGEIKKSRRKSVVTFNENVEKIIHLEDSTDNPDSDYEIYRF